MDEAAPPQTSVVSRELRYLAVASYLPSFALCIAHGVLSHQPVPAVGLVPQSVSAITSILLLRFPAPQSSDEEEAEDAAIIDSISPDDEHEIHHRHAAQRRQIHRQLTHPISVFLYDVVLAASLMIVLVFTWVTRSDSAALSMLAAYATLPLLLSFFAHLFAAAQAFHHGLALRDLFHWVAWRAVPAECPNCSHNLRPESLPELPWVNSIRNISWRRRSTVPLLADSDRYRDDPEEPTPQPEAVVVQSKRNRKPKATPAASDEADDAPPPEAEPQWGSTTNDY